MGGKTNTTTSKVTVPPEVLARYSSVNAQAQATAAQPFQQYSTDPNAFVAPLNATQLAGIGNTNTAAGQAQPYFQQATNTLNNAQSSASPYYGGATTALQQGAQAATGLAGSSLGSLYGANAASNPLLAAAGQNYTGAQSAASPYNSAATGLALAGGQAVNPSNLDASSIYKYLSPYLGSVVGSSAALLNQQNQQAMAGQLGNAIRNGSFGGDRSAITAGNLQQQQDISTNSILSGLLNQGYGQALSTAQQQQGVGLAAGQANRAATQEAAGQVGALGNQVYTQGMGTGQAQQGLAGQVFGQGATTAGQEASLAQLMQGIGQGTSSGLQSIGQGIYGMGSNTASELAGLGSGAQAASLQGAQAQLAAGQVQQQTQQAGQTALYNQFLQQQSYPFQVDQFLANIAEGTGALSGSTTTTTAPGALFSDERLKEDVRPIGKTHDGQTIYSYRYKGSPHTQIGLMAQEVEKKHPDAVGESGGFKTVDYKAATENAERPRKAGGGYASTIPGVSPYDIANILQAQQQMYAPFSSAGLYGGASSGAPHGGSSYVPQANLPIAHLAEAAPPAAPTHQSGWQTMKDFANLARDPLAQKAAGWMGQKVGLNAGKPADTAPMTNAANDNSGLGGGQLVDASAINDNNLDSVAAGLGGMARGGMIRYKRAAGGDVLPYQNGSNLTLDIPDVQPTAQQSAPGAKGGAGGSGGGGSGLGGIASALGAGAGLAATAAGATGAAGTISSILPFLAFLKDGGRVGSRKGFAGGGDIGDWVDDPNSPDNPLDSTLGGTAGGGGDATFNPSKHGLSNIQPAPSQPAGPPEPLPHGNAPNWTHETGGEQIGNLLHSIFGSGGANSQFDKKYPAPTQSSTMSDLGSAALAGGIGGLFNPSPSAAPSDGAVRTPIAGPIPAAPAPVHRAPGLAPASGALPMDQVGGPTYQGPNADIPAGTPRADPSLTNPNVPAGLAGVTASAPTDHTVAPANLGAVTPGLPIDRDTQNGITGAIAQGPGLGGGQQQPGMLTKIKDAIAPAGGYVDSVFHPSHDHGAALMSLLSGIAAAGAAPTRNGLVALEQGLGAGAETYGQRQQQVSALAKQQADTGQVKSATSEQNLVISKALQQRAFLGVIKPDPNGNIVDPATGTRYSTAQSAQTGSTGAPAVAPVYKYLGPAASAALQPSAQRYMNDSPFGNNVNPHRVASSEALADDINENGAQAHTNLVNLNEQAGSIFSPDRKGVLSQGALTPIFQPWAEKWNAVMQATGNNDAVITGLGDTQIAHKLQIGQAAAQASEGGQTALKALEGFESASAGPNLDPKAAATLLAQQAMLNTKAIELRDYMQEAKDNAPNGNYEVQDLRRAFDQDHPDSTYNAMRDLAAAVYLSPHYQTIRAGLAAGPGTQAYNNAVANLDAIGQAQKVPRLSRMFTGQ